MFVLSKTGSMGAPNITPESKAKLFKEVAAHISEGGKGLWSVSYESDDKGQEALVFKPFKE